MTQCRNRSELANFVAALVVAGCGAAGSNGDFATASSLSDDPRRAPAVAVDPAAELPAPVNEADSERGLVSLKAPQDPEAARETVRSFFRAIVHGSYDELEQLMTEDAWLQAGAMVGRQRARQYWQMRLSRLDYVSLAGSAVYREGELETYRAADVNRLRPPRALGVVAQGDDVVVRVPISTPRSGKTRLFGDEILFVLRPQGTKYAIVEMNEDFALP
jgi:ketosteroid isomerase-like protein